MGKKPTVYVSRTLEKMAREFYGDTADVVVLDEREQAELVKAVSEGEIQPRKVH
jgi:hypothetical protein